MATRDIEGVKGAMQLFHESEETSSTALEQVLAVRLEAGSDDQHVRLTERHQVKDFIKSSNNEVTTVGYEILVSELISFIKKHGKPVRPS